MAKTVKHPKASPLQMRPDAQSSRMDEHSVPNTMLVATMVVMWVLLSPMPLQS